MRQSWTGASTSSLVEPRELYGCRKASCLSMSAEDDLRTQILVEMLTCNALRTFAASLGQSYQTDPDVPRHRRQLMLPSDSKDEAQDQAPLAERMC
jgi:hypothetical protein